MSLATEGKTTYKFTMYARADEVPVDRRSATLAQCDEILGASWHMTAPVWAGRLSVFRENYGIVLVLCEGETVGFSIYQRLTVDDSRVLYRAGTNVVPSHHGRGLYSRLRDLIISAELGTKDLGEGSLTHYAWRTRNPVVWETNARVCRRVVPSLLEGAVDAPLVERARRVAAILHPHNALEVPSMIMPDAYRTVGLAYKVQPRHRDPRIDGFFAGNPALVDPSAAIFSLGELDHRRFPVTIGFGSGGE